VRNGRYSIAWWQCGKFSWETTGQGMSFNHREPAGNWDSLPRDMNNRRAIHLALTDDGTYYHVAACAYNGEDWDIGYFRSADGDTWATTWVVNDPDGTPVYDYDPELVVDDSGMVHVFWARKENQGGAWQVMYGRRNPGTGTWDTTRLTQSPAGAWQPHAAIKGDTIALVWLDYQDGASEVYAAFSSDRGQSWSQPQRITFNATLTQHPRVTRLDDGFYAVWQSFVGNNWEIYGQPLDANVGIGAGHGVADNDRLPTIVRGVLFMPVSPFTIHYSLFDRTGRRVMTLVPGPNDVSGLSPGVYFVRGQSAFSSQHSKPSAVGCRKVVIQR
jgi:hypothetical protein